VITVVLDDDPTGTQAVSDVAVVLDWSDPGVWSAVKPGDRAVHVLTNARAHSGGEAAELVASAAAAARSRFPDARLILRGDSTLRAHVWEEYDALRSVVAPGGTGVPLLLVPALPAAGRVTVGGVHMLERDGGRVPLHETEYARDGALAYSSADLRLWADERSGGQLAVSDAANCAADAREVAGALAAAAAIVFLFSFTSFGIVLILGGPRYSTIEAEIYNQAVRLFDLRAAAVLSLLQLACVVATVAFATRLERQLSAPGPLRSQRDVLRTPRTVHDKLVVGVSLGGLALFLGLPLVVLVERSLALGDGYGFDAYEALTRPTSVLLASPWEAVVNSIVYATAATAIAVVVGGLAAVAIAEARGSGLLDGLVLLPLGASAVMLGLGFLIAFDRAPLDFRAAPWIVPVAQALVAIPFVVRIVAPTLRSIDPRQREAAALLGASPGRVRREIDLPIVSRGLAVAAGFAFAISLGEFGATVFLARPDRPTLPVAIFRFLGRPGALNVAQAYALAVILMVVTTASILLVERFGRRRSGWF